MPQSPQLLRPDVAGPALRLERRARERPAVGDDALMAQVQAGSRDAFGQLYDRYRDRAYRVSRSVCRDDGRADDAVQEAFISVWRSRVTYQPQEGAVAAWLLSVVRNRAIDINRRNDRHASRRADDRRLEVRPAPDDVAGEAAALADGGRFDPMLAQIPEAQREVIVLAFYDELTHAEIATRLGLAPGTVKGRMRLGLDKLRTELGRVPAA